jgi:hypothetical protein
MEYFDFDISIEKEADGTFSAHVLRSPSGEARAAFKSPLSSLEIENFRLKLARGSRVVRSVRQSDVIAIREYGERLYRSIMQGEVETCFRTSLAQVKSADRNAGLRVRLRLQGAAELALLPWEYIYQPSSRSYLALRDDTPFVRYLEVGEPVRPLRITPPLRILAVISSPADLPPLNAQREWERLKGALSDLERQGVVVLDRLTSATVAELRWALKRDDYHVLHFIGHGGVAADRGGVLHFEDDRRTSVPLTAERLGVILREERSLRLAVLNACEGGAASIDDIFSGTAQTLIHNEIPAVVAMQFEISDDSAITFSHEFYQALAQGDPIDAAVTWARRAMFTQGDELEWGTPVLYMRAPDGRLFDLHTGETMVTARRGPALAQRRRADDTLADVRVLVDEEKWSAAAERLETLLAHDPQQPEALELMRRVQDERKLSVAYAVAMAHVQNRQYQDALHVLHEIREFRSGYKDTAQWIELAQRERAAEIEAQAAAARREEKRRRRNLALGGGAVVGAGILAVFLISAMSSRVPNRQGEAVRAGFTVVQAWSDGKAAQGDSVVHDVVLESNTRYMVLGSCDQSCDLDMYMPAIARDVNLNNQPELHFDITRGGSAALVLKIASCATITPCNYGFGIYAKPLANPPQ